MVTLLHYLLPSNALAHDVIDGMLALCGCISEERSEWHRAAVITMLNIGALHRQCKMKYSNVEDGDNSAHTLISSRLFELLAQSIKNVVKASLSSLQSTLERGDIHRSYFCMHHELSTATGLILNCVAPLSKHVLSAFSETRDQTPHHVIKGIKALIDACSSSFFPIALLRNAYVIQLKSCANSCLYEVLEYPHPVQSSCSSRAPVFQFSQVMLCFEEMFNILLETWDMCSTSNDFETLILKLTDCVESANFIARQVSLREKLYM